MPETIISFPPIAAPNAKALILGSMPGAKSLELGQYYAHPRNLFWSIMNEICGAGPELSYSDRVAKLKESGIAVWDVLKYCKRDGSLDSKIDLASEIPNDFNSFLATHSKIKAIFFNGQKSEKSFRRHVLPELEQDLVHEISLIGLPSTSPANASIPKSVKLKQWRQIENFLKE